VHAFKKIEVHGFKSFADRLEIDFCGGVTGIVGPNGCGKSNVADAIRWVLGEQSSKVLRGTNMGDVIFKGTETRKPMGYCEVSLYFDNVSWGVPPHTPPTEHKQDTIRLFDVPYDEVVLSRKLYKTGESEYFINKKPARLKDITHLLHDSGIDRDGLTIISQGQVSEIITSKPETRRGIFEEAAGISKFKHTKVEAERKLERTQADLVRVSDVIGEIEKSLAPLLKQAENAVKYLAVRDELKNLEINVYVTQYDNASSQKETLALEMRNIDAVIKSKQSEINTLNAKRETLNIQIEQLQDEALKLTVEHEREKSDKRFELFERLNVLKQERASLMGKKRTIENLIESGEGYKHSVRKIIELQSKDVVGVVANELTVPPQLECAIEVALGASAQNIITYNEDGAKDLIEYLRMNNLGRATFLPITRAKGGHGGERPILNKRCILGIASDLVKYKPIIKPVVETLLGNVLVVDNLENALELKLNMKIVTLDGDLIETKGSITGGSKNALNNNLWHNNNLALMNDAIQNIDNKISDLEKQAFAERPQGGLVGGNAPHIDNLKFLKNSLYDELNRIETVKLELSEDIAKLTHEYYKVESQSQKIDMTIEQMQIRIEEEYAMNYSACHMYLSEFGFTLLSNAGLNVAMNRVATLKRQIASLGNVNLDAIEQAREAQIRYDDYVTQVKDLEKAKADIEKVIHDLSHEMTKRFKETFEKVNNNFGHVFKELFGGGSARLELTPDENGKINVLNCGIEIIAEPPGKKLSNLTLLSGGEKALTAIAILFAILKLKPMPFVLLDEVEAALDEANVGRFASYLQNFSHNTQFIVITHRKPTMELADNLYGVTMEEKGVSKIVSVKLGGAKWESSKNSLAELQEA